MTKRIKIIGARQPLIRDTSISDPEIDPDDFARAIGATRVDPADLSPRWRAILGTRR